MANIAYVRVGVKGKTKAQQIDEIGEADKWYFEESKDRKELKRLLRSVRKGDALYVSDLLRLTDNVNDLVSIIGDLSKKNVHLISRKEKIDSRTTTGQALLMAIKVVSEFEKEARSERHAEGVHRAKIEGKYKGKKKKTIPGFAEHYNDYMSRKTSKIDLAKKLKISRGTLDRMIRDYERENVKNSDDIQIVPLQEGSKIGQLRFDDINMNLKEER